MKTLKLIVLFVVAAALPIVLYVGKLVLDYWIVLQRWSE